MICSVCCGTKRTVEIRCPETCPFLTTARFHPPSIVRKQQEQDMAVLAPGLTGLSEGQERLFVLCLTFIHRFRGEGLEAARDLDVADAVGSLASTYETESKGLIYEHRADSLPARRMASELRTVFDQVGRDRPSAFARDAATVLRRIERLATDAEKLAPGDPLFFLNLAGRVSSRIVAATGRPDPVLTADDNEPATPSIIIP
jgi:hypothetical protein